MSEETSEFGKGFVYCLGLFLAHKGNCKTKACLESPTVWLDAAACHLYEFVPESAPTKELIKRSRIFQDKVLGWQYEDISAGDAKWAFNEAKAILLEVDLYYKVPAIKGGWE